MLQMNHMGVLQCQVLHFGSINFFVSAEAWFFYCNISLWSKLEIKVEERVQIITRKAILLKDTVPHFRPLMHKCIA